MRDQRDARRGRYNSSISSAATPRNTLAIRPVLALMRAPGTRSLTLCASWPDRNAATEAMVPSRTSAAAIGPRKAERGPSGSSERIRAVTPTKSRPMTKWTISGW
jgi:hypothetical protein